MKKQLLKVGSKIPVLKLRPELLQQEKKNETNIKTTENHENHDVDDETYMNGNTYENSIRYGDSESSESDGEENYHNMIHLVQMHH